jgi:hypothetical protein
MAALNRAPIIAHVLWLIHPYRLGEDLEEWERRRTSSSIIKRRKFRKELKSLEKRISEHDKVIEVCSLCVGGKFRDVDSPRAGCTARRTPTTRGNRTPKKTLYSPSRTRERRDLIPIWGPPSSGLTLLYPYYSPSDLLEREDIALDLNVYLDSIG